jgi:hypothetical protein
VDEIKPGARKARADEYREQLYNTHDDPAETKDVSAGHPEIVAELRALLNRYRNGGYSRELPPEIAIKEVSVATLPAVQGDVLMNEPLAQLPAKPWTTGSGRWTAHDGAVWGAETPKDKNGAGMRAPCAIGDGTLDFELNLDGANRISLRIEAGEPKHTFRVVIARNSIEIARNPAPGETEPEQLARKTLDLKKGRWFPVRLTFKGDALTVQVNETQARATHAVFTEQKTALNFLVFGDRAGFRNVKAVK